MPLPAKSSEVSDVGPEITIVCYARTLGPLNTESEERARGHSPGSWVACRVAAMQRRRASYQRRAESLDSRAAEDTALRGNTSTGGLNARVEVTVDDIRRPRPNSFVVDFRTHNII